MKSILNMLLLVNLFTLGCSDSKLVDSEDKGTTSGCTDCGTTVGPCEIYPKQFIPISSLPHPWSQTVAKCNTYFTHYDHSLICYQQNDTFWYTNCESSNCQALDVNVHYLLSKDLGASQRVVVEAFDNAVFSGSPRASLTLSDFDASKAGAYKQSVLFIEPGNYYFRAYIDNNESGELPYQYQGMEPIEARPHGTFGAMSNLSQVSVMPGSAYMRQPLNIYIDKLLKQPGYEEKTAAHIRMQLSFAEGIEIPYKKKVVIQLFDQEDFNFEPVHSFEIVSESFLVVGKERSFEFITPDLPEGRYFIRAFLDDSENGYLDENEAVAVFTRFGELGLITVREKRTESIELELTVEQSNSM